MPYLPIENYGVIGNMRTSALIGSNGSIDWYCFPHFDSPSVFCGILDDKSGGRFSIVPISTDFKTKQFYWPDTNILVTWFLSNDGIGEIRDYMPVGNWVRGPLQNAIIRRIKMLKGEMKLRAVCAPKFDFARESHQTEVRKGGALFSTVNLKMSLTTEIPLQQIELGVVGEFVLKEEEDAVFIFQQANEGREFEKPFSSDEEREIFRATVDFWHRWLSRCTYHGRWREMVHRSALILKLLTYDPTGAIVAAPTTSLPESIGGIRNWDYRYCWIRDSAFTLYALMRIGFTEEATRFMDFLNARCHELEPDGSLQIMYGIDGRHKLTEEVLPHLEGYMGSKPVRVGNGAYNQLQLDIYGELLDSAYLYNKHGQPISYDWWRHLRRMINWVCDNWNRKDEGIWEVRAEPQSFVYSKVMCWVALDRGLRLADKRSFPADWERWYEIRDRIYEEIMNSGWNSEVKSFVQAYGSTSLDASILIMPLVFFLSPADPRMLSTLDAINTPPKRGGLVSNGLVYRYNLDHSSDGIAGQEGTFNMCTFWLVEALTRAGRFDPTKLTEARLIFERMLGYANHLGLYAEETGPGGEALGNFPQALTHLALISSAFNLDRALGESQRCATT